MHPKELSEMQADSAGRALSLIITKMIKNGGFPYTVYSLLFKTCVCSISMYIGARVCCSASVHSASIRYSASVCRSLSVVAQMSIA